MNKFIVLLGVLAAGCAAGPDYQRPQTELPERWGSPVAGADIDAWWANFHDAELTALIEESLAHNNDLKAAVANVDAAAASLRLARADYLPTLNGAAGATRASASEAGAMPLSSEPYTEYRAGLVLDYELDIWGRVRRANEAALAELDADIAVRDGVRAAVAAAVARAYFETRALDRQVALLKRLHATRLENLALQKTRLDAGVISPYDFEQARSETAAVAAELPPLRSARLRAITALAVLRGASPQAMYTAWTSTDASDGVLPAAPAVPMDLPSALLERRPDIRAAEQRLVAANARIGEAKAAYFPRLSLTGFAGGISTAFSALFDAPARSWEASVALAQPLSDINRVGANVNAARARHGAAAAMYGKTVQVAFQETLDALAGVTSARAVMDAQDERVAALTNAYRVAEARYRAGRIGYLELLDVERQLRAVEQQQVASKLALLGATVDLYRALGGGWRQVPPGDALAARGD